MTLHASSGTAVMQAAREAAGNRKDRPKLLGVTVLTSFDAAYLARDWDVWHDRISRVALARLAKHAGLDGAVCSALEARAIRRACGPKFVILIPGVRPSRGAGEGPVADRHSVRSDSRRALIIWWFGRPITAAANPRAAAIAIVNEIASASHRSR